MVTCIVVVALFFFACAAIQFLFELVHEKNMTPEQRELREQRRAEWRRQHDEEQHAERMLEIQRQHNEQLAAQQQRQQRNGAIAGAVTKLAVSAAIHALTGHKHKH